MIGGSPQYCPEFFGVKARYFTLKVCDPNWCPQMASNHLFRVTRAAYHRGYTLRANWSRHPESNRVELDTSQLHRHQCFIGMRGASPGMCALHLVLTKNAFRCQNLRGVKWSPEVESNHCNNPSEGLCLKSLGQERCDQLFVYRPGRPARYCNVVVGMGIEPMLSGNLPRLRL